MSSLSDYEHRYRNLRFERRDGILQINLHTNGGSLQWGADEGCIHEQMGHAFHDVAHDRDNRVVILTGTGDAYCAASNPAEYSEPFGPDYWYRITREGRELLMNLLDIDVPVISAVNGPATVHSEVAVLADIVLAAPTAKFRDSHIGQNVVPGDGCHTVWNMLLGPSRGHYYLLMPETLSVEQAHAFGVVHEILPADRLLARAWEVATTLAARPLTTLRYSRMLFTQPIKEALMKELSLGFAMEGLAATALVGRQASR